MECECAHNKAELLGSPLTIAGLTCSNHEQLCPATAPPFASPRTWISGCASPNATSSQTRQILSSRIACTPSRSGSRTLAGIGVEEREVTAKVLRDMTGMARTLGRPGYHESADQLFRVAARRARSRSGIPASSQMSTALARYVKRSRVTSCGSASELASAGFARLRPTRPRSKAERRRSGRPSHFPPVGLAQGQVPTFSVVIAAYRAGATIREAIRSALAQTAMPHEVIVVDDGSTDGTAAVLRNFSNTIIVIRQQNRGSRPRATRGSDVRRATWWAPWMQTTCSSPSGSRRGSSWPSRV